MAEIEGFEQFLQHVNLDRAAKMHLFGLISPIRKKLPETSWRDIARYVREDCGIDLGVARRFSSDLRKGDLADIKSAAIIYVLYKRYQDFAISYPGREQNGKPIWEIIEGLPPLPATRIALGPRGIVKSYDLMRDYARKTMATRSAFLREDATALKLSDKLAQNPALVFPSVADSGFEFADLAAAARHELFICGQNLHSIAKDRAEKESLSIVSGAIDRGVNVRLLICNLEYGDHIPVWSFALMTSAEKYAADLRMTTRNLKRWKAQEKRLQVRVANFVPITAMFVDARDSKNAIAVITNHLYHPHTLNRPVIVLSGGFHDNLVSMYYNHFDYVWDLADGSTRDVSEIHI